MANSPVSNIRWHEMPWPTTCPWYQSSRVTSYVLGALSCAFLGGTYYFSQISLNPAGARRLGITSIVMGAFALLLRQIPLSVKDPVYILQQRGLIHNNLQNNPNYGYKDMPPGVLSHAEEKLLLEADLQNLSYSTFKNKHGSSGVAAAMRIDREQMKQKAFKHVKEKVSTQGKIFEKAFDKCAVALAKISPNEMQSLRAECAALKHVREQGNAQEFLDKADKDLISAITDVEAIEYLLKGHEEKLNSDDQQVWFHIGWKVIGLASKLKKYRGPLQTQVHQLSYDHLTDSKYQNERDFLGFDGPEIKKILRQRWMYISYTDEKFDRKNFLRSIGHEFSPQEWTQKIVSDTSHLSVFETARQWPELFEKKILTRGSAASESDVAIWRRLQKEILDCETWENFIKTCPAVLFKTHMIPVDSTTTAFLALSYVCKYPQTFLGFNPPLHRPNQRRLDLQTHIPKALQDLKADIRKNFTSLDQRKAGTQEFLKRMVPYQIDIFLRLNDFTRIVKKIETDAALCRRFAATLYENRKNSGYAKLKEDFVAWVETTAQAKKLPLIFAWNINIEAGDLFKNQVLFINGVNHLIPINLFVLQALAADTRNFLSGVLETQMVEGRTKEICTNYDPSSFDGLMEFYKTGALHQFLESYETNEEAITRLWEFAEKLCLPKLQEVLTQNLDLTVEPLPSDSLNDVIKEVEPEEPSS
ncbi:MAG: hypothetical protein JSS10_07045 [Verrucomicrobia bacterium]|nr:hypothetical protein [Verrucomicrobiota bacterium]